MQILRVFSQPKTEECEQKNRGFSDKFGVIMPGLDVYFLEMSAHISSKVAIDDSFGDKETMKIQILRLLFQDAHAFFRQFSILELSALVSLKVATKGLKYCYSSIIGLILNSEKRHVFKVIKTHDYFFCDTAF